MRSIEEKECCNYGGVVQDTPSGNACSFEFHKGNGTKRTSHHRMALGKPTPSKWDDAQKWLVGLTRKGGERHCSNAKPRNSNADDTRLIAPVPQKENQYYSGNEDDGLQNPCPGFAPTSSFQIQTEEETKNVDSESSFWRINKPPEDPSVPMRSVCVRDMGTEMTPIASQEPSRTATPIRATTPAASSPISSGSSTPVRCQHWTAEGYQYQTGLPLAETRDESAAPHGRGNGAARQCNGAIGEETSIHKTNQKMNSEQGGKLDPLESRALAWDEAERAKYMARYKREEVKIQAWENHEKRKAEMEMKRMEEKAERLKSRARERCENKLAATRRIAEERRENAEAQLNEKAARTSERADYIRRTGRLPSSFAFKLPSLCW